MGGSPKWHSSASIPQQISTIRFLAFRNRGPGRWILRSAGKRFPVRAQSSRPTAHPWGNLSRRMPDPGAGSISMPEPQGSTLCDPETFETLLKELGSFTVADVLPLVHQRWEESGGTGGVVPRRRVLPVYPASWNPGNAGEDQIPWLVLFQSLEERLNQMVGVLARLSAGEKVVLPSPVPLRISEKGLSFASSRPYDPGQPLFLLLDLPVFPPAELQVRARVLGVRESSSETPPFRYTVLALFEALSPRLSDQLVQYMVARQREAIQEGFR